MLMSHEDMSHERFWRQILRWLASSSQDRIELRLNRNAYNPGDNVVAQVRVFDTHFNSVNDSTVLLSITEPDGTHRDIRLERSVEEDDVYTGSFTVKKEGVFRADTSSTSATGDTSDTSVRFLVTTSHVEYIDATMNAKLLKRIAAKNDGRFYTVENAHRLAEDAKTLQKVITIRIEQDVWNTPLVLMLLITILGLEWFLRRQKGMS